MPNLKRLLIALSAITIISSLFAGCALEAKLPHKTAAKPTPIEIDQTKVRAYRAGDFIEVYFVEDSRVIQARFELPDSDKERISLEVPTGNYNRILRSTGPNVAQHVLPRGVVVPFPRGQEYSKKSASSGVIVCENPPKKGEYKRGMDITVSLEAVDFGNGELYEIKPTLVRLGVLPP